LASRRQAPRVCGETAIAIVTLIVEGPAPGVSFGAMTFIAIVNVDDDVTSSA